MTGGHRNLPGDPSIRRILVIRWSALGDIAIASAAFEDLARAFPDAELHLNTMPPWAELFREDPRFDQVISIAMREPGTRLKGVRQWLATVKRERYDLIVDLQSNDRSRLLITALWLTGARVRYRLGTRPGWPYNLAPAGPASRHAFLRQREAFQVAGIPSKTPHAVLHVPGTRRRAAIELIGATGLAGHRFALFMPGSQAGGRLKRWGDRRFIALAKGLLYDGIVERVALIGSDDDREACRFISGEVGEGAVDLCGRTRVADLVVLAEQAAFVVSNDTGTAHVAAAADRPMLVICGPTDPARVLPPGDRVEAVQADIHCINCYRKACTHHSCMILVSPEQARRQLEALLRPTSRDRLRTQVGPGRHPSDA